MDKIIQQLFGLIKADLQSKPLEMDAEALPQLDSAAEDPGTRDDTSSQDESALNRKRFARKADPKPPLQRTEKTSRDALELNVNLVSADASATSNPTFNSSKRLADPFSLPAASVPNLEALRSEVQKRFGKTWQQLSSTDVSGALSSSKANRKDPELSVKVWLPDGLVRVRDDGEWMVALLSAELVEWMDKEVKILVQILT